MYLYCFCTVNSGLALVIGSFPRLCCTWMGHCTVLSIVLYTCIWCVVWAVINITQLLPVGIHSIATHCRHHKDVINYNECVCRLSLSLKQCEVNCLSCCRSHRCHARVTSSQGSWFMLYHSTEPKSFSPNPS